jgi:hypothetical protein
MDGDADRLLLRGGSWKDKIRGQSMLGLHQLPEGTWWSRSGSAFSSPLPQLIEPLLLLLLV